MNGSVSNFLTFMERMAREPLFWVAWAAVMSVAWALVEELSSRGAR